MHDTTTLSLSCSVVEFAKLGVTPEDAGKILTESSFYMEKVFNKINLDGYSEEQKSILKVILVRLFVSREGNRCDEYTDSLILSIKSVELIAGVNDTYPIELSLILCSRAINKYVDFVFLLMLTESFSFDIYSRLISVGRNEIRKSIGASLSIYEKISGGTISLMLFASILEDAINSTITPVIESISRDATLRQHFILEPEQLLIPLSTHVAEKVRGAIYLSDALIKVANK